jgi:hypothetical protein
MNRRQQKLVEYVRVMPVTAAASSFPSTLPVSARRVDTSVIDNGLTSVLAVTQRKLQDPWIAGRGDSSDTGRVQRDLGLIALHTIKQVKNSDRN